MRSFTVLKYSFHNYNWSSILGPLCYSLHEQIKKKLHNIEILQNRLVNRLLPAATKLGQGNIFTRVCDSVNRGGWWSGPWGVSPIGGCLQFFGGVSPIFWGVSPIFQGGLQFFGGVSPIFRGVLQIFFFFSNFFLFSFSNFFSPKFLLECTNPPPPDGQCAAGTHPTGMHSCSICFQIRFVGKKPTKAYRRDHLIWRFITSVRLAVYVYVIEKLSLVQTVRQRQR